MIFKKLATAAALAAATLAAPAHAVVGFADVVVDFFDSGTGPIAGPYGGTFPGAFPVSVPTSVVLGDDVGPSVDFLSLPTGSYVTVRFVDETVFDGIGDDLFITEVGAQGERANIFVTADFLSYTLLGIAQDDITTSFDLASIGWVGNVLGVRIVGLDNFGGSPGFDVVNVRALPGAFQGVPEPATWGLFILGFAMVGSQMRKRGRTPLRLA